MGRKKAQSNDAILLKAMGLFRERGFAGTSAEMLVERTGVSRYSLYSEFGSKQGLFEAALDRYNDEIIDTRFGPLERPDAGLSEVIALLEFYGTASEGPASGRGCLLCNTAVEFGPEDPTGNDVIQRYFQRLSGAFLNALENAQSNEDLHQDANVEEIANHLTAVVLGLFVLIRANAPNEIVGNAANMAIEKVKSFTVGDYTST